MFAPGIIICSRSNSTRLPNKVFKEFNQVPVLVHLLRQIIPIGIPIVLAVPNNERSKYSSVIDKFSDLNKIMLFSSEDDNDPLARMSNAQKLYGFTHVVRITHDKIFIDTDSLHKGLKEISSHHHDVYLNVKNSIPGSGFEIISSDVINKAANEFKNVEHITYAARLIAKTHLTIEAIHQNMSNINLLIDFPEDLLLMDVIFSKFGNTAKLPMIVNFLEKNHIIKNINLPPVLSIYTCAYNAEKFIERSMSSVLHQNNFQSFEYIVIDDHSTDSTCQKIAELSFGLNNIKWIRNQKNIGLASSSNKALSVARGKYIMRLDADDFLHKKDDLDNYIDYANNSNFEVIYPDNYFGDYSFIQKGKDHHHVGGALFNRNALNFIKFTEGLRNYDGLDLFTRAKNKLKIGYYNKPVFFYTQRDDSMSKTNIEERLRIKELIESGLNS